jgi:hypothetical protein
MSQVPPNPELEVNKPEAGWQFRLEMAVTNAVLGYWKYVAGLVVVVLVGVLFYSLVNSRIQNTMKAGASEIAEVHRVLRDDLEAQLDPKLAALGARGWEPSGVAFTLQKLPQEEAQVLQMTNPGLAQLGQLSRVMDLGSMSEVDMILVLMDKPSDAAKERLKKAGADLEAIAANYSGGAAASAALDAAEYYRRAGDVEGRRRALTTASAQGQGALRASAELALANLELDDPKTAADGVARLEALRKDEDTSVAEGATIEVLAAHVAAGKKDDAALVLSDFRTRWPDSKRKDEVDRLEQRLNGPAAAAPTEENPLAPAAPEAPSVPEGGVAPAEGASPAVPATPTEKPATP